MKKSEFQFTDPSLTHVVFIENEGFVVPEEQGIGISTKLNTDSEKVSKTEAIVRLQIQIGNETNEMPFMLEMEFKARFKWSTKLSDEQIEVFLNQNAPALLLSYARPLIATITNASQYPAYNIPFINFIE